MNQCELASIASSEATMTNNCTALCAFCGVLPELPSNRCSYPQWQTTRKALFSGIQPYLIRVLLGFAMFAGDGLTAQELRMEIAPISLSETGTMSFRATLSDSSVDIVQPKPGQDIGESDKSGLYRIFHAPVMGIYDSEQQLFRYEVLVSDNLLGRPRWSRFEIKALPAGAFPDQIGDLNVTISSGQTDEKGHMRLSLHSLSTEQSLSVALDSDITEVRLGTDNTIPFTLTNKLATMPLAVDSVRVSCIDPDLWVHCTSNLKLEKSLNGSETTKFDKFVVRGNPGKVLSTTFFRLKKTEDTQLNLTVIYAAASGGKPKELPVVVKVRFVPSMPYVALVLVLGALLGTLGRLLDQRQRKIAAWAESATYAVATAVIIEVVGVGLISLNSEFKIFGVLLDPLQIQQVILLGLLIGLFGANIANLVKGMLPKAPAAGE